jgi:hypothetical protein
VDQLGQLVERRRAQHPAEGGQPLLVGEQLTVGSTLVGHRAELGQREGSPVEPGPLLAEQHRRTEAEPDQHGHDRQHRRQDDQGDAGDDDVERPLQRVAPR